VPVGRVSSRREITAAALAVGGILLAGLSLVVLLRLARGGDVQVRLGSDTFNAGRADHMAERVASDGPFLLPDLSGGSRDVYLNHLGGAPDVGWVAFAARPDGSTRGCYVQWKAGSATFVDSCTGRSYPPDGTGLEQFPVAVSGGDLIVDINRSAEREAQQRQSTTSSVVESGIPRDATTTTVAPMSGGTPTSDEPPSSIDPSPTTTAAG
jgi:hypothetical protein